MPFTAYPGWHFLVILWNCERFHSLSVISTGYTRLDYQVAALVADRGETLKITGAHNIDANQALAAEIAKSLNKDDATIVTVG